MMEQVIAALQKIAPLDLAEEWDNVGLLVGWADNPVERVMTTLDVTVDSLQEAIDRKADLIVTHHPLPFVAAKRITNTDLPGRLICKALKNGISIYSPHTAWDNADGGINDQLACLIGMNQSAALIPKIGDVHGRGSARIGTLDHPASLQDLVVRLSAKIQGINPLANCELARTVRRIAICCGSGGSMIKKAISRGADVLLTGEATYHQCLEASQADVAILRIGHFNSEYFAMKTLAQRLDDQMNLKEVWASTCKPTWTY
jgi:dinuclear metal center YbgI/SA1388 family protein